MSRRQKEMVLSRPSQIAAISSPMRHLILWTMEAFGRMTVSDLAERLGRTPESIYYHMRALSRAGLIVEHEIRPTGGRPEAVYGLPAEVLVTDPTQTSPSYLEAMRRSSAAMLRLASRQIDSALKRQRSEARKRHAAFCMQHAQARLRPRDISELNRRIDDVMTLLQERDHPDGETVAVTIAGAPIQVN